jgi:hypothetical protein
MGKTLILLFAFSLAAHLHFVYAQTKSAEIQPSSTPSATPVASVSLTDDEKKKLMTEFKKALGQQKASLAHQERSAFRELAVAQKQKLKRWREDQKRQRKQFFDLHKSGPERREYVQNYLKKKEEFELSLKSELEQTRKAWAEKNQEQRTEQKVLEEKFLQTLSQGQRPGPEFWPSEK